MNILKARRLFCFSFQFLLVENLVSNCSIQVVPYYSKGLSIHKRRRPIFPNLWPPPSPFVVFLLSKFRHFWPLPLWGDVVYGWTHRQMHFSWCLFFGNMWCDQWRCRVYTYQKRLYVRDKHILSWLYVFKSRKDRAEQRTLGFIPWPCGHNFAPFLAT